MAYFTGNYQQSRAMKGAIHKSAMSGGSNTNWNQKEQKITNKIFGPMAKLEDIIFWPSSIARPKDKSNREGAN